MDIFCKIIAGEVLGKCIYEDEIVMVIMDVNPRSVGHCLVIPKEHYQDIYDIDEEVLNHIMSIGKKMASLLVEKLGCDGITFEENNGISQEVKHFHLHVIPKYEKETKDIISVEEVFHKIVD